MIIIAEKINGSIPSMAKAIENRDEAWIKDVAAKQDAVISDDDFIDWIAIFQSFDAPANQGFATKRLDIL